MRMAVRCVPLRQTATFLGNWREYVSDCIVEGEQKLLAPRCVMNYETVARIRVRPPSGVAAINIVLRPWDAVTTHSHSKRLACVGQTDVIAAVTAVSLYLFPYCLLLRFQYLILYRGPPLWSSGQSFWLQIQRSRFRFPALPHFLRSRGVWNWVHSAS
jgi:hypothetical protein